MRLNIAIEIIMIYIKPFMIYIEPFMIYMKAFMGSLAVWMSIKLCETTMKPKPICLTLQVPQLIPLPYV